jgi:cadmium resistance protein CadD (predicted permease)
VDRIADAQSVFGQRAFFESDPLTMWMAILLAVAAFAATNVDNLFVLLAFFADAREAWRPVVIGQYVGSLTLVAIACFIAALMIHIPRSYVGLIGIMPILIGIGKLLESIRARNPASDEGEDEASGPRARRLPNRVFATIVLVFVVMIGLWCVLARWLVSHRLLGAPIRRYAHAVLPWVLMFIGASVIVGSGTLQAFWP